MSSTKSTRINQKALARNRRMFVASIVISFVLFFAVMMAIGLGVANSLLFAGGMALFTLVAGVLAYGVQARRHHKALEQKFKHRANDEDISAPSRTIEIDMPLSKALVLAERAVHNLDNLPTPRSTYGLPTRQRVVMRDVKDEKTAGVIEAGLRIQVLGVRDPMDFARLTIELVALDATTTKLTIESRSTNPLEAYDMGRNLHYVNDLAQTIRRESQGAHDDALRESRLSTHEDADTEYPIVSDEQMHRTQ
jgi:hypothetical protein